MLLKEIKEDDLLKVGRFFSSSAGKEVLEVLDRTFYHTVSFTPGQPEVTFFKEGQRDIVQIFHRAADIYLKETTHE